MLFTLNQANCEDGMELKKVKMRASKKPGSRQAFTPSTRVKFEGYEEEGADDYFVPMEVPTAIKSFLKPALYRSEEVTFVLTGDAWNDVCAYLAMLYQKLPELQKVIAKSKFAMTEMVLGVEDELGDVVAELGSGTEVPGGHYVNLWSDIGLALENNQAAVNLLGRITQVKATAGSMNQASQRVNQAPGRRWWWYLRIRGMRISRSGKLVDSY
jgi:hypothetical protein